jgi:diketogulonate reductase-like aldo/keto reductase
MGSSAALTISSRIPLTSGQSIPCIGLGTWRAHLGGEGIVRATVKAALLAGYRALDCAWTYENEGEVGAGIQDAIAATANTPHPITRADLFITSKVWNNQQLPAHLVNCCKESLARLNCGYLDLYLIHWPVAFKLIPGNKFAENADKTDRFFEDVSRQDVWRAMESLVDADLVRALGVSNHTYEQVTDILAYARFPPVTNQVEAHPYFNQQQLRSQLAAHRIPLTAYSPLGNLGRDDEDKANTPLNDPVIAAIAAKLGKTPAQVIIRWHLQLGHVVIPKSVSEARLKENIAVFGWELSGEEMGRINELGKRMKRFSNPTFLPGLKKVFGDQ